MLLPSLVLLLFALIREAHRERGRASPASLSPLLRSARSLPECRRGRSCKPLLEPRSQPAGAIAHPDPPISLSVCTQDGEGDGLGGIIHANATSAVQKKQCARCLVRQEWESSHRGLRSSLLRGFTEKDEKWRIGEGGGGGATVTTCLVIPIVVWWSIRGGKSTTREREGLSTVKTQSEEGGGIG